jgi:RNA polymerase sigma-70 factor (ECF subfamily)
MAKHEDAMRSLSAARTGSAEALGEALEACRGYLLLIARRELGPDLQAKAGASDLVQQTFLEAQRDFAGFHGDTKAELLAWLRRLLLNNLANFARDYRETAKRHIGREVRLPDADSSRFGDATDLRAEPGGSPSKQVMAHERTQALLQALEKLPPDYRQVVLLRYHGRSSFAEIGQIMGRTANAARKLWLRAVERLKPDLVELL